MKNTIAILFSLLVATSFECLSRTYDAEFNLCSLSDFDRRYEVTDFGRPAGLGFVLIHNKMTGMYGFGREMKYKEDGVWKYILKQRTEFQYTDVGQYKPYPIPVPDSTPHFLFPVKENGKWGFIDLGQYGWSPILRIPCIYDDIENTPFVRDEYARVKVENRWIMIDRKGNEVDGNSSND